MLPSETAQRLSPSSASSGTSMPSILGLPRRESDFASDDERRSGGSMTSWGSEEDGIFKPPDDGSTDFAAKRPIPPMPPIPQSVDLDRAANLTNSSTNSDTSNVYSRLTTPNLDTIHQFQSFLFPQTNTSPASSTTTTHTKGESTPRAEIPPPSWPVGNLTSGKQSGKIAPEQYKLDDMTMEDVISPLPQRSTSLRRDGSWRRKHSSVDTGVISPFSNSIHTPASFSSKPSMSPIDTGAHVDPDSPDSSDVPRRSSDATDSPSASHRVVAESTATGCCISAPISPPAVYPGSGRPTIRRHSSATTGAEHEYPSPSSTSNVSTSSGSKASPDQFCGANAPRWAQPPRHTNRITGRAWSFSQGQERPDIDFDPELFDGPNPDAVQEVMKGVDGRIALKTTEQQHVILVWLPGISIQDITISSKGDRTVQIVADQWDDEDHLQWNVILGKDADMKAIGAKLEGSGLRVTIQRKLPPPTRSIRSMFPTWSAPRLSSPDGVLTQSESPTITSPPKAAVI